MRSTLSLLTFIATILPVQAQNDSYIYSDFEMKDGTVFTGYISRQSLVKETIEIKAHAIVKSINKIDAIIDPSTKVSAGDLEKKTQDWLSSHIYEIPIYGEVLQAEKSGTITHSTPSESMNKNMLLETGNVTDIANTPITYKHVILLSKAETVKFLLMKDTLIETKRQDIVAITKKLRPDNTTSGILERYETTSHAHTLEGQVTRKEMRGEITLVSDSNSIYNFQDADIISYDQVPINSEQPYWEQMPFTETVIAKNGIYEGLIIRVKRGDENKSAFMLIRTGKEGSTNKVSYDDIQEIRRAPNKAFRPVTKWDARIEKEAVQEAMQEVVDGRCILCDTIVAKVLPSKITCQDATYYIEDDLSIQDMVNDISQSLTAQGLKVETKVDSANQAPILIHLVKEKNFPQKRSHFTLDNQIATQKKDIENGNGTFVYGTSLTSGYYVLYWQDTKKALVINIK